MKWTSVLMALVAIGAALGLSRFACSPRRLTPIGVHDDVRDRLGQPGFDERLALRSVDRALDLANEQGDHGAANKLLILHAELLRTLGSLSDARADLEQVLSLYQPENFELELSIVEMQAEEGLLESAHRRVLSLLERWPEFSSGWRARGQLEARLADAQTAEAIRLAEQTLVRDEALQAKPLIESLGARALLDPARLSLSAQLREFFMPRREDRLETVLNLVDDASRLNDEARSSLARSFRDGHSAEAVQTLMGLYTAAGRADLAAEIGESARRLPAIGGDHEAIGALFKALSSLDRHEAVIQLAEDWRWGEYAVDVEFCAETSLALYHSGGWSSLGHAVQQMRIQGGDYEKSLADLYIGLRNVQSKRHANAIKWLQRYVTNRDRAVPFPDALALAFEALSFCFRESGDTVQERRALESAIAEAPDHDGTWYLRVVHLSSQIKHSGHAELERLWTRGIELLPTRYSLLMERWAQLGERSLEAAGLSYEDVLQKLETRGRSLPTVTVGPHTKYRIALAHLERGRPLAAVKAATDVLDTYPDLIPAIDVIVEAYMQRRQLALASEWLLKRLRLAGNDVKAREFIHALGSQVFTAEQLLEAMRSDPGGMGRAVIATGLLEQGEPERALRALTGHGEAIEDREQAILAGRARVALGRFAEAAAALEPLMTDERFGAEAIAVLIRARLAAEDRAMVEQLVEQLATSDATTSKPVLIDACDALLEAGEAQLALKITERLDAVPVTRGGDVLFRIALASLYSEDFAGAHEALERAEAFVSDGTVELAHLVVAIAERNWVDVPTRIDALKRSLYEPTALEGVIWTLLAEDHETAYQAATAALEVDARDAGWGLVLAASQIMMDRSIDLPPYFGTHVEEETRRALRGNEIAGQDPRDIFGLLLALNIEGWDVWATPRLFDLAGEDSQRLWAHFFGALGYAEAGERTNAIELLEELVEAYPSFGPAWDELERLVREEHPRDDYHPSVIGLRKRRSVALGPDQSGDTLRNAMDSAAIELLEGDPATGVEILKRALDERETPTLQGRDLLARLYAKMGEYNRALIEYSLVASGLPEASDHPLVDHVVKVIEQGIRHEIDGVPALRLITAIRTLNQLETRFPRDPLIVLMLAKLKIRDDVRNPVLAVPYARRQIEALRRRAALGPVPSPEEGEEFESEPLDLAALSFEPATPATLEQLRKGASRAWVDFLQTLDMELAEEVLQHDLLITPGNLDLWILLGRIKEGQKRSSEALRLYRTIVQMSSDPETHYRIAWILATQGGDGPTIEEHLASIDSIELDRDPRARLVRARAELQRKEPDFETSLAALEELWSQRESLGPELTPTEIGRTLAQGLLLRHEARDLERLKSFMPELDEYTMDSPYLADLTLCLAGLGPQIEPAQPAPAEPDAGSSEDEADDQPAPDDD